jgi:hypothetical protein
VARPGARGRGAAGTDAGLGLRFAAWLLDTVAGVLLLVLASLVFSTIDLRTAPDPLTRLAAAAVFAVPVAAVVGVGIAVGRHGQSLGHRLTGTRVVDRGGPDAAGAHAGAPVGALRGIVRTLLITVPTLLWLTGALGFALPWAFGTSLLGLLLLAVIGAGVTNTRLSYPDAAARSRVVVAARARDVVL